MADSRPRGSVLANGEWAVLIVLAIEIALFSLIAPNFATAGNLFEVARLSVELGLLAIALTPVLVTGGIDLSVGAMMGLAAVIFGAAYRDWHLPIPLAACVSLLAGCAGGALNAFLVARLNIPPLIVTLGTFSLFRGVAEGITHAAVNYTGFPAGFLALGQGYLWGVIPAQLPMFFVVFAGYAVLLHRSVIGRASVCDRLLARRCALRRHSGGPPSRPRVLPLRCELEPCRDRVRRPSGTSPRGRRQRLRAGRHHRRRPRGTSVFGGRGTLFGTLVGLFALAALRNGLRLAALPSELAGVLTGTLLVATIAIDRLRFRSGLHRPAYSPRDLRDEAFDVKNSQVAALCATVLAGALIVASTNVWLVRLIAPAPADYDEPVGRADGVAPSAGHPRRHRDDAQGQGRSRISRAAASARRKRRRSSAWS